MKKQIILIITVFSIITGIYGQQSITRSTPDNSTKEYIARDYVRFAPGYSFTAGSGKKLRAAIDPNILIQSNYLRSSEIPLISDRELVSSHSVGTMPGTLDVTPTGAAAYTMPIEVAPGVMGVQPNLALVYNSQTGNGIAGWGVNISGLSAITRVPKNIYLDGYADGIKNSGNDAFSLDGNRLLAIEPKSYEVEYKTEVETFSKIIHRAGTYIGSDWFEITAKDGTVYKYGSNSGRLSYYEPENPYSQQLIKISTAQAWQLDHVQSPNGQTITYEYENADLCSYIKKITYGDNSVDFFYETRKDKIPVHFDEKKGAVDRILHKIVCRQSGTIFREYKLEYTKDYYSRLVQITESNGGGESYNPTLFEWGASAGNELNVTENIEIQAGSKIEFEKIKFEDMSFFSADINGDGLTDLCAVYGYSEKINGINYSKLFSYFLASRESDGSIKFKHANDYSMQLDNDGVSKSLKSHHSGSAVLDYNGDGKQDLLFVYQNYDQAAFYIALEKEAVNIYEDLSVSSQAPMYAVGDLNNDGKSEIVYVEKNDRVPYSGGIISQGKETEYFKINSGMGKPNELFIADFDGDGMNDLLVQAKNGYTIYYNNGGNTKIPFSEDNKMLSSDIAGEYNYMKMGDFNGDGLPDFLLNPDDKKEWYIALNNGGRKPFTITLSPTLTSYNFVEENFTSNNDNKDECFVWDFDGDGKSDIIINDSRYKKEENWIGEEWSEFQDQRTAFFSSTGDDFLLVGMGILDKGTAHNKYFSFGDFNGDGMQEMLFYGYDCYNNTDKTQKWRLYSNAGYNTQSGKITGIADGLNNKVKIEYTPLTDAQIYRQPLLLPGYLVSYPVAVMRAPLPMVKEVTFDPDMNSKNSVSYFYMGSKVHLHGKGFLGFYEITATNFDLNRKTTSYYAYNKTNYYSYLQKQQITDVSGQQGISETTFEYEFRKPDFSSSNEKRFFPYVKKQTAEDRLTGLSVETEITAIDDYGNPKTTKTTKGSLTETQTASYIQKGSWCPNKVENVQITRTYQGETETRQTAYEYDDLGNLLKETIDPDDNNQVITEYSDFTAGGQPQTITVTTGGTSRKASQTYSPSGRFIASKTNALNETTTYEWDEAKGLLKSVTDHRNRTTRHTCNKWGELVSTNYPDGTAASSIVQWSDSEAGKPGDALYYSRSETSGQSPVWVWYDAKGRELRKHYLGLNGKKIFVDTEYTPKGQVAQVSKPYFEGEAKTRDAAYNYDNLGRVETVTTPMGETAYTYSGLETTVTTPAGTKKTTLNSEGLVASQETNGKKVDFTYYPNGQAKTAAPQDGKPLSMEYDLQGNRTKLTDPDAGVITSRYNGWGELEWTKQKIHKDQAEITTEYDYDPASGLLNFKKTGNQTTYYQYDDLYRLEEVSIDGQHIQRFTYDKYDRVTGVREEIEGRPFDRAVKYDRYGRVEQETYPSGYVTINQYDENGYLIGVTDNAGRNIWQAVEANASGQLTKIKNGTKETTYGFDDKQQLASILTPGIMDWTYGYDEKGNMTSRRDGNANFSETFAYDQMNRLTGWDIYQGSTLRESRAMQYDPATGNILSKSDAGFTDMKYSEEKPHALASLSTSASSPALPDLEISYTDFKKVKTISDNSKSYELMYGVDEQRRKSIFTENGNTTTRYYLGDYEIENTNGNVKEIHYLHGGGILIKENGQESLLFAYTDHLGSLVALTDYAGNVLERHAYDPWGNRRNAYDWTRADDQLATLNRGFTMHEHLDQFGIINMNGRVYDPITSQFLSPDPYVQAPGMWLNYNRYGYCWNNPLMFTDPSGEWVIWDDLIVAAVGGIINLAVNAIQGNIHSVGQAFASFGVGAAGAWAGLYGGPVVSGMIIGGGNSYINQGFGNDGKWNQSRIDYGNVVTGIAMGGLSSGASYALGSIVSPYVSNMVSGWGGQAVQQAIVEGTTGTVTGFVINASFAWGSGADFWAGMRAGGEGAAWGFGFGFTSGMVRGTRSAWKANENPLTGKVRPMVKYALADDGIYGTQKGTNPEIVDKYLQQMKLNEFNLDSKIGGFQSEGKYYIGDGHHRMLAASKYYQATGDRFYIDHLISTGRWTQTANTQQYGITVYKLK